MVNMEKDALVLAVITGNTVMVMQIMTACFNKTSYVNLLLKLHV